MYVCQSHGRAPWTKFGCSRCLAATISNVTPREVAIPTGRVQGGLALVMWVSALIASRILLYGAIALFLIGKVFDLLVLIFIEFLEQFDSSGVVTGALWWIYAAFIILPIAVLLLFIAWMAYWSDPNMRRVIVQNIRNDWLRILPFVVPFELLLIPVLWAIF